MTAESVRVNSRDADEKRERNRSDSDPADEWFGETKLPAEQPVDSGAD
jgi:hypothetical protein